MKNLWNSIISFFGNLFGSDSKDSALPESKDSGKNELALAYVAKIPQKGDRGQDVFLYQERLVHKGYDPGVIDGIFGSKTESATKKFQKAIGLIGTGIIGVKTLKALMIEVKAPEAPKKTKGIPTREEMSKVVIGMIEGTVPTRIGPYKNIRETHGNNRSPVLDDMIRKQGGSLGDPYCQWGLQEVLDELCRYYGVARSKVMIPKGGSTQTVYGDTPARFKTTKPQPLCWMTWRHGTSWQGHVGMVLQNLSASQVQNFEFNTTVTVNSVVRDGQGASYVKRSTGKKIGNMNLRGYIDQYEAIVEAMQK